MDGGEVRVGMTEVRVSSSLASGARTLLLCTCAIVATGTARPALAERTPALSEAIEVRRAFRTSKYEFDIPAGKLGDALHKWADASKLNLLAPSKVVDDLKTDGVSGTFTPEQALKKLLIASTLKYELNGSQIGIFDPTSARGARAQATMLPTITVRSPRPTRAPRPVAPSPVPVPRENAWGPVNGIVAQRSASGTKTDTPLRDTPASVSVISRKQIEEQGAQSVADAVRTTPGVVTQWAGYDNRYDFMYVRGFPPTIFLNGLILPTGSTTATHGIPQIEPYGLERIEVLRGSASALYGQVPAGGILNLVSKRPTDTPFGEVQLQTGSYARKQVAFDVGGPVTQDGTLLYRLTGLGRDADTQVDFTHEKRAFIAPSFTWRPTADTTFTFLSSYQKVESNGIGFYPEAGTLFPHPNGRIPKNRYLGEPGFGGFNREAGTIGYAFEHRFNDSVSFKQNLQYASSDTLNEGIAARAWVNSSQQLVRRDSNSFMNNGKTFAVDNQLTLKLNTGPVSHTVLTGIDYQNFKNEFWYRTGTNNPNPINPFNPVYSGYTPLGWATRNHTDQHLEQLGVYVQDQVRYDRWLLTLTGRHDSATLDTFNHVNGATTDRVDTAFSGRAGLNYLFDGGWSPYVSYSTSFQPIVGTDFSGNTFAPSQADQIEAGIKYQPDGSPIFAALSVFDITRTNITTSDPVNTGFQVQTGEARVRGVELEVKARPMDALDLIAAYAYSESEVTKSNDTTTYNGVVIPWLGKQLPFVPRHQASLWAYYTFDSGAFHGLSLGGGVRYVGALYGDNANVLETPAAAFLDLAAAYDLGKIDHDLNGFHLQVNVRNILDEYYVTCTGANACYIGEGRSALATLTYRWGAHAAKRASSRPR
jgi:iron complex outermembrane receptor protein